jgi:hypothetical protein
MCDDGFKNVKMCLVCLKNKIKPFLLRIVTKSKFSFRLILFGCQNGRLYPKNNPHEVAYDPNVPFQKSVCVGCKFWRELFHRQKQRMIL